MSILTDLQKELAQGHTLKITPCSDFYKQENIKRSDLKYVYNICIHHPDKSAGIFFSEYAHHYNVIIEQILDKHSNGKLYSVCCSECGYDLKFEIIWNKNRQLKKVA